MQSDVEQQIAALENLHRSGCATWEDLTRLGIAYRKDRQLTKAIHHYKLAALATSDPVPWFNMGLVFNDPEISQDADAADVYRRALAIERDYERAQKELDRTRRKLAPLAIKARAAAGAVVADKPFAFYVSPFEALRLDGIADEELDARTIQRAKKRLLQEMDLNDGRVSWLDGYSLDNAQALAIEDELHDETKRRHHRAVFENKQLLRFLTHGDIEHFLYSDDYFPRDTLELLDRDGAFRSFLSKPFSRQYNRTLTRAIEQKCLPVVEVLFDGRRWIEAADEDVCFQGACRQAEGIVQEVRAQVAEGESRKISVVEIEAFLRQQCLPELFNLLPAHFALYQKQVVSELYSLAVAAVKNHHDLISAQRILGLCKRFTARNVALTNRLDEDYQAVERILGELHNKPHRRRVLLQTQGHHSRSTQSSDVESFARECGRACRWVLDKLFGASGGAPGTHAQTTGQADPYCPATGTMWAAVGIMALPLLIVIAAIWASSSSSTPTEPSTPRRTTPSSRSYVAPTPAPNWQNHSAPVSPPRTDRQSGTVYRVPSYINGLLESESKAIDREKAIARQMESELERLDREIERDRAYLNHTSQFAVDAFNRKVNDYNVKVEQLQAQNRRINQLVDSYNAKLRQYGR